MSAERTFRPLRRLHSKPPLRWEAQTPCGKNPTLGAKAVNSLKILTVAGCRPNFVKIAPLMARMRRCPEIYPILVHTGQHYDDAMSEVFFRDLNIPKPDIYLNVGSTTYAQQTALIMQRLEGVLLDVGPHLVLVVGDVNSTVAASLTAVTLGYPVAHVEAGLRSFDREMPEEINRVLTDAISDILFATESSAVENLLREGRPREQIFFVGNVMIDTLV
ncbi:MAG: UDP-N-acetylglucosamine 2-epimerase, partial [Acidobacteria bacterium]|nr:UDP-N-acetylglucosamine 2-epimerase [Acidobacteriota bacterium]